MFKDVSLLVKLKKGVDMVTSLLKLYLYIVGQGVVKGFAR